jgi:hypothetical protein
LSTFHLTRAYAHSADRINRQPWLRRALRAVLLALHDSRRRMARQVLRDYSHLLAGTAEKPRR